MRKLLFLSLAAVVLSCGACSKDGAAGPAGAVGPVGPAGPAGADGTSGIIYSDWIDVTYDPILADADEDGQEDDTVAYETVITAEKLTQEILTSGEIKVFINTATAADPIIFPVPYTDIFRGYSILPTYGTGEIYMLSTHDFKTFLDENGVKNQQYRYVLIPGGTAARKAGKNIDWNNYSEVKAYLKLKD